MCKSWVSRRIPSLYIQQQSAPSSSGVLCTEGPRVAGQAKSCRVLQAQETSCNRVLFIASRTRTMPFGSRTVLPNQARSACCSNVASSKPMPSPVCAGATCQHCCRLTETSTDQVGWERAGQLASDMGAAVRMHWACFSDLRCAGRAVATCNELAVLLPLAMRGQYCGACISLAMCGMCCCDLRCAGRAAMREPCCGACDARAKLLQLALSGGRAAVACDVWDVQLRQLAMHGPCGGVGRAAATCAARAVLWQLVMRRPCGCDLRCVGRAARGEQKRARQGEVIAGV